MNLHRFIRAGIACITLLFAFSAFAQITRMTVPGLVAPLELPIVDVSTVPGHPAAGQPFVVHVTMRNMWNLPLENANWSVVEQNGPSTQVLFQQPLRLAPRQEIKVESTPLPGRAAGVYRIRVINTPSVVPTGGPINVGMRELSVTVGAPSAPPAPAAPVFAPTQPRITDLGLLTLQGHFASPRPGVEGAAFGKWSIEMPASGGVPPDRVVASPGDLVMFFIDFDAEPRQPLTIRLASSDPVALPLPAPQITLQPVGPDWIPRTDGMFCAKRKPSDPCPRYRMWTGFRVGEFAGVGRNVPMTISVSTPYDNRAFTIRHFGRDAVNQPLIHDFSLRLIEWFSNESKRWVNRYDMGSADPAKPVTVSPGERVSLFMDFNSTFTQPFPVQMVSSDPAAFPVPPGVVINPDNPADTANVQMQGYWHAVLCKDPNAVCAARTVALPPVVVGPYRGNGGPVPITVTVTTPLGSKIITVQQTAQQECNPGWVRDARGVCQYQPVFAPPNPCLNNGSIRSNQNCGLGPIPGQGGSTASPGSGAGTPGAGVGGSPAPGGGAGGGSGGGGSAPGGGTSAPGGGVSSPGRDGRACIRISQTGPNGNSVEFRNVCSEQVSVLYCSTTVKISGHLCGFNPSSEFNPYYTHLTVLKPGETDTKYDMKDIRFGACMGFINNWDPSDMRKKFRADMQGNYTCLDVAAAPSPAPAPPPAPPPVVHPAPTPAPAPVPVAGGVFGTRGIATPAAHRSGKTDLCASWEAIGAPVRFSACSYATGTSGYYVVENAGARTADVCWRVLFNVASHAPDAGCHSGMRPAEVSRGSCYSCGPKSGGGARLIQLDKYQAK